jgi:nucleoside-diphosphate-sugar epimerase
LKENLGEHEIITVGRNNSNVIVDLAQIIPSVPICDIIIHAAGKAHLVPKTEKEKEDFYNVNVYGTRNLLSALENHPILPYSVIYISSVAVYGLESGVDILEEHPLNASDPYGHSKIEAEQLVKEWCERNSVRCAILRLPLLAGLNPPGNLGSMINGIRNGYYVNIAGGRAKKSIVLAKDIADIIPKVAEVGGVYNLTDGYHPSFIELSKTIAQQLNKSNPLNIPLWIARFLGKVGDLIGPQFIINSAKLRKVLTDLTFNDSKARRELGWSPNNVLNKIKIK